jgi:hypothetical protein
MVLTCSGGGDWIKFEKDTMVWRPFSPGWEGDADKIKERQEMHSHVGACPGDSTGVVGHDESLSQHATGGVPF